MSCDIWHLVRTYQAALIAWLRVAYLLSRAHRDWDGQLRHMHIRSSPLLLWTGDRPTAQLRADVPLFFQCVPVCSCVCADGLMQYVYCL